MAYSPVIPPRQFRFFARYLAMFSCIWVEKDRNGNATIKGKIERLDLSKRSFCEHPASGPPPVPIKEQANLAKAHRQTCQVCGLESLQIYEHGWICLNLLPRNGQLACAEAQAAPRRTTAAEKIQYDPRFLAERIDRSSVDIADFNPPRPAEELCMLTDEEKRGITLQQLVRGTCCLKCGKCLQRTNLQNWKCDATSCDYKMSLPIQLVPLVSTLGPRDFDTRPKYKILKTSVVGELRHFDFRGYNSIEYLFTTGEQNFPLYVLRPTKAAREAEGGPNAQFVDVLKLAHEGAIPFERKPFGKWENTGTLSSYFTWSGGEKYDYRLKDIPAPRYKWPPLAEELLDKYSEITTELMGRDYKEIDQFMINLYEPKGGLHMHSDRGTQGFIFSVTLGAPCRFKFLVSGDIYTCLARTGFPGEEDEAPPGTHLHKSYTEWLAKSQDGKTAIWKGKLETKEEARRRTIRHLKENKGKVASPAVLDLDLRHGDIVIMQGGEFQEHFWHHPTTDSNLGPRINLTGRSIAGEPAIADGGN